jgi:hypothetical protein
MNKSVKRSCQLMLSHESAMTAVRTGSKWITKWTAISLSRESRIDCIFLKITQNMFKYERCVVWWMCVWSDGYVCSLMDVGNIVELFLVVTVACMMFTFSLCWPKRDRPPPITQSHVTRMRLTHICTSSNRNYSSSSVIHGNYKRLCSIACDFYSNIAVKTDVDHRLHKARMHAGQLNWPQ